MKARGFTLIEILIVMVIISIVATTAMLTIHFNQRKQVEDFSEQLSDLISLAENNAMMHSVPYGIALSNHAIQFYVWNENKKTWEIAPSHVFHEKKLLDNMRIVLKIHDQTIPADGVPRLIVSPNGDLPEFVFYVA